MLKVMLAKSFGGGTGICKVVDVPMGQTLILAIPDQCELIITEKQGTFTMRSSGGPFVITPVTSHQIEVRIHQ